MTLFTKKGDCGLTVIGGKQLPKNHPRLELSGSLDELNTVVGMLEAMLPDGWSAEKHMLGLIQNDLSLISSVNAASECSDKQDLQERTARLEHQILVMESDLPALNRFVIPGGHVSAAWAHIARTVCRRAERRLMNLEPETRRADMLPYLNRLSDFFFDFARLCNIKSGTPERYPDGGEEETV